MLFSTCVMAQVNETANERYYWNKKGTEPQPGYVVLKSGTRMEGTISLKGSPNQIEEIILVKDGKEMELKPASLSAYGLFGGPLINDSPEEMYEWKNGSTTTNAKGVSKVNTFTKSRRGFVVLNDGKRIDGMLHLNKVNGVLDEIVIKNDADGKKVLNPAEVSRYGLIPTVADLTKGGKKVWDDDGKNFKKGFFDKTDQSKVSGIIAFMKSSDISNSDAIFYQNLFYAPTEEEPVTVIPSIEISKVTQMKGDTAIVYVPFNGGFVEESKIGGLAINEQFKLFQRGRIILANSTEITGEIAQVISPGSDFCNSIKFKTSDDKVTVYGLSDVNFFEQIVKNEPYHFIPVNDRFVRLLFDGLTFAYYKNPTPTTINESATRNARAAAGAAGSIASMAAVGSMKGVSDADKNKINQSIQQSSTQELQATSDAIGDVKQSGMLDEQGRKNATKAQAAMMAESMGRAAQEVVIYNVEYFIWNKKSGEKKMVVKADFGDGVEPLLQSCEKYLLMSKQEQKEMRKMDNFLKSLQMLDDCYNGKK